MLPNYLLQLEMQTIFDRKFTFKRPSNFGGPFFFDTDLKADSIQLSGPAKQKRTAAGQSILGGFQVPEKQLPNAGPFV